MRMVFIGNHEYCKACTIAEPIVRKAAEKLGIPLVAYDTDADATSIADLCVESLPTTIVLAGDDELGRIVGAFPYQAFLRQVKVIMEAANGQ